MYNQIYYSMFYFALSIHIPYCVSLADRFPRGIGGDHTQGPGMNQEAEARAPDTQGDLLRPKQVMMKQGSGFTLCELVIYE